MEGAKLYDVFQKISKGEFSPLPAEEFSHTLRQLVVRMLEIDPDKRPDLDEVWMITQGVIESQVWVWVGGCVGGWVGDWVGGVGGGGVRA